MSFTNKASRNIMGTTIHKLLHITGSGNIPKKTINSLKKYKYFIIDEIGMISNQLWKYLMLLKKENPKAVFILIGDWRQLLPIEEGRLEATNIFNHPVVKFLCNGNKIELTTRKRYDKALWDFLEIGIENNVWEGLNEKSVSFEEIYSSKNICYYNKTRVCINRLCMDYFAGQTNSYFLKFTPPEIPPEISPEKKKKENIDYKQQSVWLYEGLPVMSWKNNVDMNIVNSEEFVITFVDKNKLVLKRDCEGGDIEIETEKFHDFFLANYCATTHKSQGATYAGNVILWDWDRIIREKRVAYTACSRATAKDKLIVSQGILQDA
jgi:ATP-dependent exoDNAse (exonuclease V) alpha subunit